MYTVYITKTPSSLPSQVRVLYLSHQPSLIRSIQWDSVFANDPLKAQWANIIFFTNGRWTAVQRGLNHLACIFAVSWILISSSLSIQETAAGIVGNLCTLDSCSSSLSEKIQRTLPAREPGNAKRQKPLLDHPVCSARSPWRFGPFQSRIQHYMLGLLRRIFRTHRLRPRPFKGENAQVPNELKWNIPPKMWRSRKGLKNWRFIYARCLNRLPGNAQHLLLSTSFLCHSCVHQFHLTESKTKENGAYITVARFPQGIPEPATGADRSVEGDDILFDDKRWSCGGDLHPPWESWDPPDLTLGVWICENFRYQNKSHSGKVTQWLAIFLVVVKMLLPKKAVLWYTIPLGPASFSIVLQTHQNHTITWLWLTRAPVGWLASWLQFKLDHLHTTKYREFWMSLCVRVIPPSTDASTQCDFYGPHTVQL